MSRHLPAKYAQVQVVYFNIKRVMTRIIALYFFSRLARFLKNHSEKSSEIHCFWILRLWTCFLTCMENIKNKNAWMWLRFTFSAIIRGTLWVFAALIEMILPGHQCAGEGSPGCLVFPPRVFVTGRSLGTRCCRCRLLYTDTLLQWNKSSEKQAS